jgi:pyruvate kinase
MQLLWGVYPVIGPKSQGSDEMVNNAVAGALSTGIIKEGDLVVITAGVPAGTSGTTNLIRVHVVGNILLRGTGIGHRTVTGKICIAHSIKDVQKKFQPGDVLVVESIDEETAPFATKAAAIITEEGGLTSHAAVIAVSFGVPVIVGVDGATDRLTNGTVVTVDSSRGVVYQGEINAK